MASHADGKPEGIGISISQPNLAVICLASGLVLALFLGLAGWIIGLPLAFVGMLLLVDYYSKKPHVNVTAPSSNYCRACGTENEKEAMYCEKCGTKLLRTATKTAQSETKMVVIPPQQATQKPQPEQRE